MAHGPLVSFYLFRQQNEYLPWLFFKIGTNTQVADRVLDDDKLSTEFTFSPASFLEYRVARYLLNGTFLGVSTAKGGRLQLCSDTTSRLDAAYTFGTYYEQTVRLIKHENMTVSMKWSGIVRNISIKSREGISWGLHTTFWE